MYTKNVAYNSSMCNVAVKIRITFGSLAVFVSFFHTTACLTYTGVLVIMMIIIII